MPHLEDFDFQTVDGRAERDERDGLHTWQYTDAELKKLENPKVKAFFIVNPVQPGVVRDGAETRRTRIVDSSDRSDRTSSSSPTTSTARSSPGFRSLAADLPHNTILVYSYSKHFGCTGWRLGVVALHEDNILDQRLARLPERDSASELHDRYCVAHARASKMKFIDRMVADSRDVALNHTAGLSLPQQVQMTLFSLFSLLDEGDTYKLRAATSSTSAGEAPRTGSASQRRGRSAPRRLLRRPRSRGVGRRTHFGEEFMRFVASTTMPLDIVFALARTVRHGAPERRAASTDRPGRRACRSRTSTTEAYLAIGRTCREAAIARATVAT